MLAVLSHALIKGGWSFVVVGGVLGAGGLFFGSNIFRPSSSDPRHLRWVWNRRLGYAFSALGVLGAMMMLVGYL